MNVMNVIGYIRVSTEEQATSGVSLEAQRSKLEQYATLYNLQIVDIQEDAGLSAKTLRRPGLQAALQQLREGVADGLLVAKLDRLTRSVADLATLLHDYFTEPPRGQLKRQLSLHSVADQFDTRSAGGRLVMHILASVAQWEREAISERTRAALAHLKASGVRLGARPTQNAEATLFCVRLYADQFSLRHIAEELNHHVSQGKQQYHTQKGGRWTAEMVKRLLVRAGVYDGG